MAAVAACVPALAGVLQAPALTGARIPAGLVEDGDIVFRRGHSLVSRMVLAADGDAYYSHAGIIQMRGREPWVVHASADEPDDPPDGVRAEPLWRFLAPDRATAEQTRQIQSKGGISNIEIVSEDVLGETAEVTAVTTYGNGSTQRENTKRIQKDGEWKITLSK